MKKILFLIIFQFILNSSPDSATALYPSGPINDDISYSDLEIIYICKKKREYYTIPKEKKPRYVSGCLNNKTGKAIYFKTTLIFNDFFNRPTAQAKIKKNIPAYGQACFKSNIRLKKPKFSDFKLDWQQKNIRQKKPKSVTKPTKTKKSGESSIRKLNSGLQITGRNSVTTETFHLKKGVYSFRASVIGNHFNGYLMNKNTQKKTGILSQTGKYNRKEKINVEDGFHSLKISARDSWRIEIEFPPISKPESKLAGEDLSGNVMIYLKNGEKIIAEQLTIQDDKASIISCGTTISLDKESILKTESTKTIEEKPEGMSDLTIR